MTTGVEVNVGGSGGVSVATGGIGVGSWVVADGVTVAVSVGVSVGDDIGVDVEVEVGASVSTVLVTVTVGLIWATGVVSSVGVSRIAKNTAATTVRITTISVPPPIKTFCSDDVSFPFPLPFCGDSIMHAHLFFRIRSTAKVTVT